jgi:hypothetical protein
MEETERNQRKALKKEERRRQRELDEQAAVFEEAKKEKKSKKDKKRKRADDKEEAATIEVTIEKEHKKKKKQQHEELKEVVEKGNTEQARLARKAERKAKRKDQEVSEGKMITPKVEVDGATFRATHGMELQVRARAHSHRFPWITLTYAVSTTNVDKHIGHGRAQLPPLHCSRPDPGLRLRTFLRGGPSRPTGCVQGTHTHSGAGMARGAGGTGRLLCGANRQREDHGVSFTGF